MEFSIDTMNKIDTKIAEYLEQLSLGTSPYPLAYCLNNFEIEEANELLSGSNQSICVVKINYILEHKVCYYKHPKGDFTITMDLDNKVVSID